MFCKPASYLSIVLAIFACVGCVRSETREKTSQAPSDARARGSIEGNILHPGGSIPPMRICAIGSGAPEQAKRGCVKTRANQTAYRIDGLPADDYIVVAQAEGGSPQYRTGGHMQQVQCIRAPCPSMPASVTVGAGAQVKGIDLNEFFDKREDFPASPDK